MVYENEYSISNNFSIFKPKVIRKFKKRGKNRKQIAHSMVSKHIKNGSLKKEPCAVCGSTENIHAHHEDYGKPLDVVWLCPSHHKQEHLIPIRTCPICGNEFRSMSLKQIYCSNPCRLEELHYMYGNSRPRYARPI